MPFHIFASWNQNANSGVNSAKNDDQAHQIHIVKWKTYKTKIQQSILYVRRNPIWISWNGESKCHVFFYTALCFACFSSSFFRFFFLFPFCFSSLCVAFWTLCVMIQIYMYRSMRMYIELKWLTEAEKNEMKWTKKTYFRITGKVYDEWKDRANDSGNERESEPLRARKTIEKPARTSIHSTHAPPALRRLHGFFSMSHGNSILIHIFVRYIRKVGSWYVRFMRTFVTK